MNLSASPDVMITAHGIETEFAIDWGSTLYVLNVSGHIETKMALANSLRG